MPEELDPSLESERIPTRRVQRFRYVKSTVDRIITIAKDMVYEGLEEGYEFATGKKMYFTTEGAMFTHISDAVLKMKEVEQKKVLKKFKEILKG